MSLKGSLAKNYFGDNLHTLTRQDARQAIEQLSDNLHLNMKAARLTRLDVSTIIQTERPPAEYYRYLGNKPFFKRLQSTPDTLYYNNHQRQIIFYDKTKEAVENEVQLPGIIKNSNLFRYELRFNKRIEKQLKTVLKAEKLVDREFYRDVIKKWNSEFKEIQKVKNQRVMTENIKTVKEAVDAFLYDSARERGQSCIDDYLEQLKYDNVFEDRQRYYEVKKKLKKIMQATEGERSDLVNELENKIFNIARYAR